MIDWWILDSIRLKRPLPFEFYRPIIENPFLASFHFHFFQLEDDDAEQNTLVDEDKVIPIDLIKSLLKRLGASVADTLDPLTTHVITQFQCEHLLPTQLLGPVHFVTLPWLLKILSAGCYSDPCDAIDFPCPIHPIPDSSSLVNHFKIIYFYICSLECLLIRIQCRRKEIIDRPTLSHGNLILSRFISLCNSFNLQNIFW